MLLAKKRTVRNTIMKTGGHESVKSRHAMPLHLSNLYVQQKDYDYCVPKIAPAAKNATPKLPKIKFDILGDELLQGDLTDKNLVKKHKYGHSQIYNPDEVLQLLNSNDYG